jgi:NAD(P)-dependent dehydrogenase (short-subunit alcohol dehydrogenase family)
MKKNISLVIGGTSGIGKDIVEVLKKNGERVVTLSRKDNKKKNHVSYDILNDEIENLEIKMKWKIKNLIFAQRYRGSDTSNHYKISAEWPANFIKKFQNKIEKNGSIVFLGSIASDFYIEEQDDFYHGSRGAIKSLVKYFCSILGKNKIRVNSVSPDFVIKNENKIFFRKNNRIIKKIEKKIPLKRVGTARDVSNLVMFLCSDKSTFITGQNINVDGGLTVARN